jgi:glyoxylase-like metal-dependent hydrolase (beta-lactamase superfamily II)
MIRPTSPLSLLALVLISVSMAIVEAPTLGAEGMFTQPDAKNHPNLFVWTDTCNVYVWRDGDSALLIDLGDGSVLDKLKTIGVKNVEWVLFTHHHREQCQGAPKLKGLNAKIAGPEAERALFEKPASFRKMKVRLGDRHTIHGTSYVRPPVQPIKLDRGFARMDTFTWRSHEFWCLETKGNSPGAMSYMVNTSKPGAEKNNAQWLAFTGDLMLDGAKLHNWFDSEWDYGFAKGIYALSNSAGLVEGFDPALMLPSHGPTIKNARKQLIEYRKKLATLEKHLVRGYPAMTFSGSIQDPISRPTKVPHLWQVSEHIFKFKGPDFFPNFYLIMADNGHALLIDCGLLNKDFLDKALEGLKKHYGLKQIDAVIPTHMHGDHFLEAPHLRQNWGAQIWALENMADVCEHPEWFDYCAPIQAYGKGIDGVKFDRLFKPGEKLNWQGYKLTVDWMPGQTEFALCVTGMIDGKKVAFTGDNLFGDPTDPTQTGHEAVVAHNSAVLEEGYIYGAEYLSKLKPDILLGGHSYVMDKPAAFIERYRKWSYKMRDAFRALSYKDDYRYMFDPFWVRAQPYRSTVPAGSWKKITVTVRNFRDREQKHRIKIQTPPGIIAEPAVLEGSLAPETRKKFTVQLRATQGAKPGVNIVAFDVTLDGKRYGQWFDCVVEIK